MTTRPDASEDPEAQREAWLYLQVVCLLIAFVDPVFAPIMRRLPDVEADPFWSRLLIAGFSLAVLGAAVAIPAVRARANLALITVLTALHVITAYQVVVSGNHPLYVGAALLAVFGSQLAFARIEQLVGVLLTGLLAWLLFAATADHLRTVQDAAAFTILANGVLISSTMGVLRIRIQDREKAARRALAEAESEARQARAAAEAANHAKSAFLANMSHELRTPLNAILGYTELLRDVASDEGLAHLDGDLMRVHGAGTHLLALINDVLDLAKVEAGRMELKPEEFVLNVLISDVATLARPLVERNANALAVVGDTDFTVVIDRTRLRQVLLNLISNAAKFTEGGTITLTTSRAADRVVLEVADTGIGMNEEQVSRLFKAFVQVHTEDRYGGTGLGLVLSERFTKAMGGDLTVRSEVGRGTTFTVTLPIRG